MNFLALAQRVRQECDAAGTGPSTVSGQTGELKNIVDWTAEAYRQICQLNNGAWKFLESDFSVNTVIGQAAYLPTACTDTNLSAAIGSATVGSFKRWKLVDSDTADSTFRCYLQSLGLSDNRIIRSYGYGYYRDRFQLQTIPNAQPVEFAIRPRDNAILIGPAPDAVYVITGQYYRIPPALAANSDTPVLPDDYHMAIVWKAAIMYAGDQQDRGLYQHAQKMYRPLYNQLCINWLEGPRMGAPLA